MRFADALTGGINGSELLVFETCAHATIYQSTAEFNEKTLNFLKRTPASFASGRGRLSWQPPFACMLRFGASPTSVPCY